MQLPKRNNAALTYSEILRVVGQYIDRNGLSEIRVLETEDGVILQGLVTKGENTGQRVTYEVSVEDIEDLYEDGFAQRGQKIS